MTSFRTLVLACAFAAAVTARAEEDTSIVVSRPKFTVFHEFGRYEKALFENYSPISARWVHRTGAWLNFTAKKERLGLDVIIGGTYYVPTYQQPSELPTKIRYFAAAVPRLDVSYVFGDMASPSLKIDAGVFTYKYNEYARNLGEYLYRTGTYPGWIVTGGPGGLTYLDAAFASLTGVKLSQSFGMFSHDLLLNLETEIIPTFDLNVSYMAKLNMGGVFKVGAGVEFTRLIAANPSRTNPEVKGNNYFKINGEWYTDKTLYYDALLAGSKTAADSAKWTAARDLINGGTQGTDSAHYSASGIKPLAYFSFDPKPLFGNPASMGPNDLVLYGEAALLGVKDYPIFYDDMMKRIPMMIGFNIPTFKFLDVLAVEFEKYGSLFPNSTSEVQVSGLPLQTIPSNAGEFNPDNWTGDDIKWSVFAKRKIIGPLSISAQVARDHARGYEYPTGRDFYSIFKRSNDWYWLGKLVVNI